MLKILVTGASGFVGQHLVRLLLNSGYEVIAHSHYKDINSNDSNNIQTVNFDLLDEVAIRNVIKQFKPNEIIHLAAQSSVFQSWLHPTMTLNTNLIGTANLFTSIRDEVPDCKILTIGSAEEYGTNISELRLTEDLFCNPTNPYAISKYAVYILGQQFHHMYGLQVIHARPFNHIGPGQRSGFVVADFAKQFANVQLTDNKLRLKVGNLKIIRDFTDVRDVVNAYMKLIEYGTIGEVYNVCTGVGIDILTLLSRMAELTNIEVTAEEDPSLVRKLDIPVLIGSPNKINRNIGWHPRITVNESLTVILKEAGAVVHS